MAGRKSEGKGPATPEAQFFDAPDLERPQSTHTIAYYDWGRRHNPRVLLCVHGLTRNGNDFGVLAHALSDEYRVVCPDLPGRGRSDWLKTPGDYTYPVYLADINALLDHLGIDSVDWIGTSMGGILGMMMAGFFPNKVRRLVLNDIGAVIPVAGIHRIRAYVGKRTHFSSKAEAEQALRQIYAPFGIRDEAHWWHLFAHSMVTLDNGSVRLTYDPAIGASLTRPQETGDIDLWPVWEAVNCPVLLLRGAASDILTSETAEQMKRGKPDVTMVEVKGVGHAPSLMEASQISLIRHWLSLDQAWSEARTA